MAAAPAACEPPSTCPFFSRLTSLLTHHFFFLIALRSYFFLWQVDFLSFLFFSSLLSRCAQGCCSFGCLSHFLEGLKDPNRLVVPQQLSLNLQ